MTHNPSSLKKVAVLTGLTALIGGAEISNTDAATISEKDTFDFSTAGGSPATQTLSFNGFNSTLGGLTGVLTGVQLTLESIVSRSALTSATTSVVLFGNPFPSSPNPVPVAIGNNVDFSLNGVSGTATLADYIGSFSADLTLTSGSALSPVEWIGSYPLAGHPEGLTVTYTYTPTPLPATLPFFAGGLAGLGFMTWRSRRKQTAKE